MKNQKSKIEIAFEWAVISLLFAGVISTVYGWMHGGLS